MSALPREDYERRFKAYIVAELSADWSDGYAHQAANSEFEAFAQEHSELGENPESDAEACMEQWGTEE